jgi:hypothetical protein
MNHWRLEVEWVLLALHQGSVNSLIHKQLLVSVLTMPIEKSLLCLLKK